MQSNPVGMSWLKGAFDKVKEKSAVVKGIAREVVDRSKAIKARLTGAMSAKELEASLESKAGAVSSCKDLTEFCRSILVQWDELTYGYVEGLTGSNKLYSFPQIFLRGRCLDLLLEKLVTVDSIRSEISQSWLTVRDESEHTGSGDVASVFLYQTLKRVTDVSEQEWYNGVSLLFCEDVPVDSALELVHLICTVFKRDWFEDWLLMERRELEAELVQKRKSILNATSQWSKIALSSELVEISECIRDNLDTATAHRLERRQDMFEALELVKTKFENLVWEARDSSSGSVQKEGELRSQKASTDESFGARLASIADRRSAIDVKLTGLESERKRLRMELDRVSVEIDAASREQRDCMSEELSIRDELLLVKEDFANLLSSEKSVQETAQHVSEFSNRARSVLDLAASNLSAVTPAFTQLNNGFIEALQEHIAMLSEFVQDSYRRVKGACDELDSASKSCESFSNETVQGKLTELESESSALEQLGEAVRRFLDQHESKLDANRLLKGEIKKLRVVLDETVHLLEKHAARGTQLSTVSATPVLPPMTVVMEEMEEDDLIAKVGNDEQVAITGDHNASPLDHEEQSLSGI